MTINQVLTTKKMLKKISSFIGLLAILVLLSSSGENKKTAQDDYIQKREQWVNNQFEALTEEERIAQLFMVAAYSNKDETHYKEIDKLVKDYKIGGLIFFQGGPMRESILTNRYQKLAKTPLLIGFDGEWGLAMRLDSTMQFPKQMTLGAIQNDKLIVEMGEAIGEQCKRIGIHVNFAPVVDVNVNPKNPIIGVRSFGEQKELVARKGIAYMRGLQNVHVMANAKHFPGHGDTESDSHHSLPVINHDMARIDSIELYPFKQLFADSLASVMVAHLQIPAIDNRKHVATTLSPTAVTQLLKNKLNFQGLIFTDALNMKGVSAYYKPGEVDLLAFKAGNDVLLFAENVPRAIKLFQEAIVRNEIDVKDIENRVKKILRAKYWVGLNNYQPVSYKNLQEDLHTDKDEALRYKLYEKALTVVNNQHDFLPIQRIDTLTMASVAIGAKSGNDFQKYLNKYGSFEDYTIGIKEQDKTRYDRLINKVKHKELVVVGLHHIRNRSSRNYGIGPHVKGFIDELSKHTKVVVVVFGNPYSLKSFTGSAHLICAYEDNDATQKAVPQLIFGAIGANGKLPVSVSANIKVGYGQTIYPIGRTGYSYPSTEHLNKTELTKIDTIVHEAIQNKATPGCQVMVLRNGKVVFDKSYGYQTYDSIKPINGNTMYDVASVTKVLATTQILMELYSLGEINLDSTISYYLPELKGSNKENMVIRDVLSHQAGLWPYLSHWSRTLNENDMPDSQLYCYKVGDSIFCNRVSDDMYASKNLEDSVYRWTIESELIQANDDGSYRYRYSDLGYYFLVKLIEKVTQDPFENYLNETIYAPMGLTRLTYLPLQKFKKGNIAPTEQDDYFRNSLIQGTVHDQGAAMLGGVAGHAGIFANTNEIAKILQMNLQEGFYGNRVYFVEGTVDIFTSKQFENNRRALGWDKPDLTGKGPTSEYSSANTYGHSGFTGTCVWIDPDYDLIYIFLSNRVYPSAENKKLISTDVRTRIHDVIYQSLVHYNRVKV
jgi:beta-N-acetylhexosaminidase